MKDYMSLKDFSDSCGISEKTIKNNVKKYPTYFPGFIEENGLYYFPEGSRYPYNIRMIIDSVSKRKLLILKALNNLKFVNAAMIQTNKIDFQSLLDELKDAHLIEYIDTPNKYGTNQYKITERGTDFIEMTKEYNINKTLKLLTLIIKMASIPLNVLLSQL